MGEFLQQPMNPQPDKKIYVPTKNTTEKTGHGYLITKIDYEDPNGITIHYAGVPFPRKGFPTMQTSESVNFLKKLTLLMVFNPIMFLSKKSVARYLDLCDYIMDNPSKDFLYSHSHWIKDEYMCTFAREFQKFLEAFFSRLNIDTRLARVLGRIAHEDDAYRYRIQDMFSETSLVAMYLNPRGEIKRLIKLGISRESVKTVSDKTMRFASLLSLALLVPKYKKAFKEALRAIDFSKLQLDDADKYYCLRPGYDYMGMNEQQREEKAYSYHKDRPPLITQLV